MWLLHQSLTCFEPGHKSLTVLYKKLIWSFDALWSGFEPVKNWLGEPIAGAEPNSKLMGGKFMAVWALTHDMEHGFKCYELPNPTSNNPCGLCPCNSSDVPWFDFRVCAEWLSKIFDAPGFVAAGHKKSNILQIVGVTVHSLYPDWMHCKSLGTDKPLIGLQS